MRKEKILEILENAKDGNGAVPMRLVRTAFDKLPEPCEDTISRQAAIDAAKDWYEGLICGSVNGLIKKLKALPSAQPEPQWIPVSERLPDTNRDVLLQFSTSMGVGFWEHNSWGVNTGDNIYSEIGEGEAQPIAWMPLPKPFEGGAE